MTAPHKVHSFIQNVLSGTCLSTQCYKTRLKCLVDLYLSVSGLYGFIFLPDNATSQTTVKNCGLSFQHNVPQGKPPMDALDPSMRLGKISSAAFLLLPRQWVRAAKHESDAVDIRSPAGAIVLLSSLRSGPIKRLKNCDTLFARDSHTLQSRILVLIHLGSTVSGKISSARFLLLPGQLETCEAFLGSIHTFRVRPSAALGPLGSIASSRICLMGVGAAKMTTADKRQEKRTKLSKHSDLSCE